MLQNIILLQWNVWFVFQVCKTSDKSLCTIFPYPLFFSSNFSLSTSSGIPPLKSDYVKLNTSTLPTSFSSSINFIPFSSFNCSSGNSASDLDCTIKNNVDNSSKNDQCKNGVSTFFFLCFPNDLSNGGKNRLIRIEFVAKSNCVFSITKRQFSYNCLSFHSWLVYFLIPDEPYHPFCVLFWNKVVILVLELSLSGILL